MDRITAGDGGAGPLVSCIMPTADRPSFAPLAVAHFLGQDYPSRELIVVDDGGAPVADLIADDPRIRYIRLPPRKTIGAKRNLACQEARGEIILHWDDDDWMAPGWISRQVATLTARRAEICGLDKVYFYEPARGRAWQYIYTDRKRPWVCGATMCYTKDLWRRNPFPDLDVGEDAAFVWSDQVRHVAPHDGHDLYVAYVHDGNTSPKRTGDSYWHPVPVARVERLVAAGAPARS